MPKVRVLIRNKPGVFDPEGKVIHGGLQRLGHDGIARVRVGKVIDLEVEEASDEAILAEIDEMCRAFLVNPVIEDYTVEITRA